MKQTGGNEKRVQNEPQSLFKNETGNEIVIGIENELEIGNELQIRNETLRGNELEMKRRNEPEMNAGNER